MCVRSEAKERKRKKYKSCLPLNSKKRKKKKVLALERPDQSKKTRKKGKTDRTRGGQTSNDDR